MKKIFFYFVVLINLYFLNLAHASGYNSYYCEKGFRNIQTGDSVDAVRAACGDPTSTNTREEQTSKQEETVRWVYALGVFNNKNVFVSLSNIVITFHDQRVIELNSAGASVTRGNCAIVGGVVNIGDTVDQVLQTCGQPNFINNMQQAVAAKKTVTEWIYNNGPYKPQIILDFESDKLTQIISGQLGK